MRFELFLAARYLKAKRRQAVVGVVTAISIAGVAAGVAALIIALAITNGMRRDLQDKLARLQRARAADARESRRHSRLAAAARAPAPAAPCDLLPRPTLRTGAGRARSARWRRAGGRHSARRRKKRQQLALNRHTGFGAGTGASSRDTIPRNIRELPPIVLGQDLAESIGASVGDSVMLVSPQGELTPLGMMPKVRALSPCRHLITPASTSTTPGWAFMRLADAQTPLQRARSAHRSSASRSTISTTLREIGSDIEQAAGNGFMTTNWMEQNRELFRALRLEQVVTFIVIALIVIVAALNILIALTMMVMEKTRDIAVMMSFGVDSRHRCAASSCCRALLISVIGTVLGLVLGYSAPGPAATTTSSISPPTSTPSTRCPSRRDGSMA